MRVDKRNESITPLQALTQLNNQLVVAMARHFAKRVEPLGATAEAQIDAAFGLLLQRAPQPEERAALADYTRQHGLANACRVLLNLNELSFVD